MTQFDAVVGRVFLSRGSTPYVDLSSRYSDAVVGRVFLSRGSMPYTDLSSRYSDAVVGRVFLSRGSTPYVDLSSRYSDAVVDLLSASSSPCLNDLSAWWDNELKPWRYGALWSRRDSLTRSPSFCRSRR